MSNKSDSFTEPEELDDLEDSKPNEKIVASGIENQNTKKFDTPAKEEEKPPVAINDDAPQADEEAKETERGLVDDIQEAVPEVEKPGKFEKLFAEKLRSYRK